MSDMIEGEPEFSVELQRLTNSRHAWRDRLSRRIAILREAFAEDYPGQRLSVRSVRALIDFLELLDTPPGYPEVTATPAGDLYAEWRQGDGRHVSIELLDSGEARWLVLGPNPRHPERVDRLVGMTTSDALRDTIGPLVHLTGIAA